METIKLKQEAKNGKLLVQIPKEMENKVFEVSVTLVSEKLTEAEAKKRAQQRGELLIKRFNKAKHKEFILREDDVYYQ